LLMESGKRDLKNISRGFVPATLKFIILKGTLSMLSTPFFRRQETETAAGECPGRIPSPLRYSRNPRYGKLRKTYGIALFLIFLFSLNAVPPSAGEEAAMKLTLQEAVRMALDQNPGIQIAGINLARSENDKKIARSALFPEIRVEVSETRRRSNFEAFTGRTLPEFPTQVGPFNVFQGGGSFSLPVFDLALWRKWQAAGEAVGDAKAQAGSVLEASYPVI
jgi:hypothetical protein